MKTVRTFGELAEAGFARSLLEAAGIEALLADEQSYSIGYGPATGGLRLQVDDADFERAQRVLDQGPDAEVIEPSESTREIKGRIPVGLFLACAASLGVLAFALVQWRLEQKRAQATSSDSPVTSDQNGDGRPDRFDFYKGQGIVLTELDGNHDGRTDSWCFYDAEGRYSRVEHDHNLDGKPDNYWFYEMGVAETEKRDTDFNGLIDRITTFDNEVASRVDYMPNESTIVTRREVLKHGVLTETWVDENHDGTFDYKTLHDPFGETSKPIPIAPGGQ